jgi:hypothetical protein
MSSFGDDLLEIVDDGRAILGPDDLDLRPTRVAIITRTWSGGVRGDGYSTDTSLLLPDYTKVRNITSSRSFREMAGTGGLFELSDLVVGPVTPQFVDSDGVTRGFTEAELAPPVSNPGVEIIYRMTGQSAAAGINGDYYRIHIQRDRRLRFLLVVGRERTTPGPV